MSIKEIIDGIKDEQECDIIDNKVYKAECEKSWSRIAELVMERAEFVDRIAELEQDKTELKYTVQTYVSAIEQKNRHIEELYGCIAELEAQLPKVVKPVKLTYGSQYDGRCKCGKGMYYGVEHCTHCGAKLDWSES